MSGTTVTLRRGTEGPKHDPYAWEEVQVETKDHRYVAHLGLAAWIEVDGQKFEFYGWTHVADAEFRFKEATGYYPADWERFVRRLKSKCRSCGCKRTTSMRGYPGESFDVCAKCGSIVNCHFNESAII